MATAKKPAKKKTDEKPTVADPPAKSTAEPPAKFKGEVRHALTGVSSAPNLKSLQGVLKAAPENAVIVVQNESLRSAVFQAEPNRDPRTVKVNPRIPTDALWRVKGE